ncbi:MAG: hypothetical protein JNJ61_17835, partial [Anaerolineae bacterium]|nr:hypothetical protein [Anaerolineae bacterium]
RWTAETPASQGRLVFGALSSISLWMAVGLAWWLPTRLRPALLTVSAGYFAVIALLTPFLVIAPAYARPQMHMAGTPTAIWQEAGSSGAIGLDAARIITSNVRPESYAQMELDLQIVQPLSRNWSLFVHLVTPDGVIVEQRDVYPGGGRLATSDLKAGDAWVNPVAVWLPITAYAPMTLTVEAGWYDLASGERLRLPDGRETVSIGEIQLQAREDDLGVPNPVRINFGHEIELVGYALSDLSPAAGDTVTLTLYWRGLTTLTRDYKVFANILDVPTLTKYAASDGMPVNWQAPTSTWRPGVIIEDPHTLTVDPNAPAGMFSLEVGLYWQSPEGSLERLRVVTADGGMADNFIYLNRVRILPAETP